MSSGTPVPPLPYAEHAELLRARVDRPEQVSVAWREAFAAERPALVEAIVDPDTPLLAPRQPREKAEQTERAPRQEPSGEQPEALLREQRQTER